MFERLRADWKASAEALERNERRRSRAAEVKPTQDGDISVTVANDATIAGNVANGIVNT